MAEKELGLTFSYDPKGDVLYCSFGAPREGVGVEVEDGLIMRLDPDKDTVVGITIIDFCKRFAKHPGGILSFPLKPEVAFRPVEK